MKWKGSGSLSIGMRSISGDMERKSGSPVFIFNEGGYQDKRGNTFMGSSRIIFLGTLYAGPQHTVTGEIDTVNISTKDISISQIPNNLGLVIKHQRILELEELF